MSSLLESVSSSITPELTSSLGARFSISEDAAHSALQTSSVAMLTTLAGRASDKDFLSRIHSLIAGSGVMAASASGGWISATSTRAAEEFTTLLFGNQLPDVEASLSKSARIPKAAASGVFEAAAPLVIGVLADQMRAGDLDAAAFGSALAAELPRFQSFLPDGFTIPSFADFSPAVAVRAEPSKDPAGWLWPVLIVGALFIGGLVWYFSRAEGPIIAPDPPAATKSTATVP
jgi:hypothetical protein